MAVMGIGIVGAQRQGLSVQKLGLFIFSLRDGLLGFWQMISAVSLGHDGPRANQLRNVDTQQLRTAIILCLFGPSQWEFNNFGGAAPLPSRGSILSGGVHPAVKTRLPGGAGCPPARLRYNAQSWRRPPVRPPARTERLARSTIAAWAIASVSQVVMSSAIASAGQWSVRNSGYKSLSASRLTRQMKLRGHEIPGDAQIELADAIDDKVALRRKSNSRAHRTGDGEAGPGQLNDFRCSADMGLDRQSGMAPQVVRDQVLVRGPEASDQETRVRMSLMDEAGGTQLLARLCPISWVREPGRMR